MRPVLLLMTTTSYRAGAFLGAARRLGVPIVVGSDRRQALAAINPVGHLALDFLSLMDATRAIVEFAKSFPIGAVISADDEGAVLAAMASQALDLRHSPVAAVETARNKLRMRESLKRLGFPSPGFRAVSIDDDPRVAAVEVHYPCVLKPLVLSASRGVIRAADSAQFAAAFGRIAALLGRPEIAAQAGGAGRQILVEDYLPGAEVALEGLLSQGRLRPLALFDKPDPLAGPFFEETIYVTPSRLEDSTQRAVVETVAKVAAALELTEGPVHAELRVNDRGPWMLEIAPRSIGGLCSRALRFGDGVSLEELILRAALGLEADSLEREAAASGVMMIPIPRAGVLRQVSGEEEARAVHGVEEIRITIPVGQELVPLPEGARYLGFIFARAETPEEVEAALREAHRRLGFVIEPATSGRAGTPVDRDAHARVAAADPAEDRDAHTPVAAAPAGRPTADRDA